MSSNDASETKVCLVTGGSAGIGKETVRELTRRRAQVVLVCRDRYRGETAAAECKKHGLTPQVIVGDLASQREVRRIASDFCRLHDRLDALVLNAGALNPRRQVTPDGLEQTFAVNHLAPFLLTDLLLPLRERSAPARIVVVASQVEKKGRIDFEDLQAERAYDAHTAYNQSKLANVLFTYALARKLEPSRVTVNCIHPGVIATGLLATFLGKESLSLRERLTTPGPSGPGRMIARLALDPELATTHGGYFWETQQKDSSPASHDRAVQERLWSISKELTSPPA